MKRSLPQKRNQPLFDDRQEAYQAGTEKVHEEKVPTTYRYDEKSTTTGTTTKPTNHFLTGGTKDRQSSATASSRPILIASPSCTKQVRGKTYIRVQSDGTRDVSYP